MKQFIIALLIIAAVLAAAFSIFFYIETNFENLYNIGAQTIELVKEERLDDAFSKLKEFESEYKRICRILDYTANTLDQQKLEIAYWKMVSYLKTGQLGDCIAAFEELRLALNAMCESESFSFITIF